MPGAPRVSIVVPTYNSGPYLDPCVRSILDQTMPDLELILYDDASSDGTVAAAEAYRERDSRVRVIRGEHGGIASARNRGFATTDPRSEFVTFFDHDDVWEPDALETLVQALETNPECVGAHGLARCIDSNGKQWPGDDHAEATRKRVATVGERLVPLPLTSPTTFGAELVRNYITTPGTSVVRRSVQEAVGSYEAATVPCDDWDMNLRICRRGDYAFVDKIVLNWRRHDAAASHTTKRWRAAYLEVRWRSIRHIGNTDAQREAARHALAADILNLRREATQHARKGRFSFAAKKLARSLLMDFMRVRDAMSPQVP
jgi:glycosyltransferase involved in cell wall biosynthesis